MWTPSAPAEIAILLYGEAVPGQFGDTVFRHGAPSLIGGRESKGLSFVLVLTRPKKIGVGLWYN